MYLSIGTESCPYSSRPPYPNNYSSWVTLKFYILKRWHCIHVLPQHSTPIPEAVSWRGQWPFYTVDFLGDLCDDELILLHVSEGKEFWSGRCWLYSATLHQMIWPLFLYLDAYGSITIMVSWCEKRIPPTQSVREDELLYMKLQIYAYAQNACMLCTHAFRMCHWSPWHDVSLASATSRNF